MLLNRRLTCGLTVRSCTPMRCAWPATARRTWRWRSASIWSRCTSLFQGHAASHYQCLGARAARDEARRQLPEDLPQVAAAPSIAGRRGLIALVSIL
jgi:hypothetical protein